MTKRMPSWLVGLLLMVFLLVGSYFAFTKVNPFANPYTVTATFQTAQNVRVNSPVRIAGVDVGKVTAVENLDPALAESMTAQADDDAAVTNAPSETAAVVTMEIEEAGLPIKEDATFALEPRLFLEGNLLVNIKPGSPSAPEAESGYIFPINQSSVSVQLDQLLTTLQSDVRGNLQDTLDSLGNAFIKYDGAQALRVFYRSSPSAFKNTSYVNEALLGTEPGDLSGLIKNLDKVIVGLNRDEAALQGTVTNFRVVTGSFAAEDEALAQSIATLPDVLDASQPAYANLNAAFPPLRALAREALPGVRSTPETLRVATPLIRQVRGLVSRRELRGLVADLRPAVPELAQLANRSVPLFNQGRLFSSCLNEVLNPFSYSSVEPPEGGTFENTAVPTGSDGEPLTVFEETTHALEGLNGESRSGDANGQYIKVQPAIGTNSIKLAPNEELGPDPQVALTANELLGLAPGPNDSAKTPFRDDVRCERQEPPNLETGAVAFEGEQNQITPMDTLPDLPIPPVLPRQGQAALDTLEDLAATQEEADELRQEGSEKSAEELEQDLADRVREIMDEYRAERVSPETPEVGG